MIFADPNEPLMQIDAETPRSRERTPRRTSNVREPERYRMDTSDEERNTEPPSRERTPRRESNSREPASKMSDEEQIFEPPSRERTPRRTQRTQPAQTGGSSSSGIPRVVLPVAGGESDDTQPYEDDDSGDTDDTQPYADDLFVSEETACWASCTEYHKSASNTKSFSFVVTPENKLYDIGYLPTTTEVQARYLDSSHDLVEVDESVCAAFAADKDDLEQCLKVIKRAVAKRKPNTRKEASTADLRKYRHQFDEAKKLEHQSWIDNDVFDLVDLRKHHAKNFVTGRWVLTIKCDRQGTFLKCKARWVLMGFPI